MQTGQAEGGKAPHDWAAGYQARNNGVPAGLALEDLKISFQGNVYALDDNQPLFAWGTDWKRKQVFQDLPSLTRRSVSKAPRAGCCCTFPRTWPSAISACPENFCHWSNAFIPAGTCRTAF